jgi:hypothetical protein
VSRRQSIILFGEGKTDGIFLNHLLSLYRDQVDPKVKVDAGQGGSPKQVASRLIKKHLALASYDRSLLLMDGDLPLDEIPASWRRKHRISIVQSSPACLEGLLLTLLGNPPPPKDRRRSRNWKRRFHREYLGTDREAEVPTRLGKKCGELFPKRLIESKREHLETVRSVLEFLGV